MDKTIPEVFFETAKKFSSKTALLAKENNVYFSYHFDELEKKIKIFSKALLELGAKKGDNIAILSENRPEWVIADLGIMLIGAVTVPIHTTLNAKAICNVINHSEAKIIIVSGMDLLVKVMLFQNELPFLEKIIYIEKLNNDLKKTSKKEIIDWEGIVDSLDLKEAENIKINFNNFSADDACSIIYTSGTTGIPKGVMLTHKNFLENAEAVKKVVPVKTDDIFLSFLPLSHVLERLAGYYIPLLSGATIAYAENVKKIAENLKEVKPTILISVPRIFEKFYDTIWDKVKNSSRIEQKLFLWALKQKKDSLSYQIGDFLVFKKIRKKMGGRLRLAVSGGASLNHKIAKFFLKMKILILEGYGLTETAPVISVNEEKNFKFGTVGRPLPGVKVKISPEKEILVKGPNVMKGYYKNEEETLAAFDKEGWFHTGDLGFIDNEGFLTVIGRKKEMIVLSGGKNVWPEVVEKEINHDPFVSQSMVIGHNRKFVSALIVPDWQEVKKFFQKNNLILKNPEELVKSPELIKLFKERIEIINKNLSSYEDIKKFKLIVNEFSQEREELTPTLKLRRHIIENHYEKEIKEIYS